MGNNSRKEKGVGRLSLGMNCDKQYRMVLWWIEVP